jgi:tRNA-intron endonuclease, archaea type
VETERLVVQDEHGQVVGAPRLIMLAAEREPGFEVEYLVYRELRTRGYLLSMAGAADRKKGIHFLGYGRGDKPTSSEPTLLVTAWSERYPMRLPELDGLIEAAKRRKAVNLLAIVDEESDVTYYDLALGDPKGQRLQAVKADCAAVFLKDRVLIEDEKAATRLHDEGFFGKPIAKGLQLSLVESIHLARDAGLKVVASLGAPAMTVAAFTALAAKVDPDVEERLAVYSELRRRGLTVKTGFKFGTHFRLYDDDPRKHHAPYLVQVVAADHTSGWAQVSRAIRLAHSVRKTFLFAAVKARRVHFVQLSRARP